MKKINKAEFDGNNNIVIQNIDESTTIININNPKERVKLMLDLQAGISELPKQIIDLLTKQINSNQLQSMGANIYLGLCFLTKETSVEGICFNVAITNLTKEIRFYNAPFFKLSVPNEEGLDTFFLAEKINSKNQFPKKLEYGEVISEFYSIKKASEEFFRKIIEKDSNATVQAIVNTTLGEIYMSKGYSISKLLESFKYAR